MRAVLCLFAAALTCTPPLAVGIPVQLGFNFRRVEGVWHRVAMAVKGAEAEVVGEHIRIMPLSKGDLSVQQKIEIRNTCRQVSNRYRHTNTPGKFNIIVSYGSQSTVHFVATDYRSYLVVHTELAGNTGLYLFARGLKVSDTIMEKFEQHSETLGFSKRSILYPTPSERCTF